MKWGRKGEVVKYAVRGELDRGAGEGSRRRGAEGVG